jgi:hypothetical protein
VKEMAIDLRKDAIDFRELLAKAVKKYATRSRNSKTAKKYPPVTRIDFTYSLGDSESTPWAYLHLGTDPKCEPCGQWSHPDFAHLDREAWLPSAKSVSDGKTVPVTLMNGKTQKCGYEQLVQAIGEFLVSILIAARDDGVLKDLPKGKRCELGVEEMEGAFGWPAYDDRGKENLV